MEEEDKLDVDVYCDDDDEEEVLMIGTLGLAPVLKCITCWIAEGCLGDDINSGGPTGGGSNTGSI